VTVGPAERLAVERLECGAPTWCGTAPTLPLADVLVQVRAHGEPVPASADVADDRLVVEVGGRVRGVAPGQTAVLYDGDRVIGSATVDATS
jgi:tRNA-specific 2-thiouridylase